jgi:hypothetical protein
MSETCGNVPKPLLICAEPYEKPAYAYIYSTEPQTILANEAVYFNSQATNPPISFSGSGTKIVLSSPGSYLISFELSTGYIEADAVTGSTWVISQYGTRPQSLNFTSRSGNCQVVGEGYCCGEVFHK